MAALFGQSSERNVSLRRTEFRPAGSSICPCGGLRWFIHELPCWGISMNANSDGLAIAVTPHRSGLPADPGATDDLDIGYGVSHLGGLIALGFVMTLVSATFAFELWGGLGASERAADCAGVLLFGLVTCRLIWMLPAERGAVVIVSRYGILALRISNECRFWDSFEDVSVHQSRGCKAVMLTHTPALLRRLRCVRSRRAISPQSDADFIDIDPAGLATDFATLLRAYQARYDASERRTALQQKGCHDAQSFAVKAS
ncbi:hypothetical protein Q3C01_23560 [Bradyrhizobium sp. UFLA05-109]